MTIKIRISRDSKEYYKNGESHREDGPAVELFMLNTGRKILITRKWYINGKLHRVDGPAIESTCTDANSDTYTHIWYFDGELHREDGPAVEDACGINKEYYIDGIALSEEDFLKRNSPDMSILEQFTREQLLEYLYKYTN